MTRRLFIEVTDTAASPRVSGFPRHTRELTTRLVDATAGGRGGDLVAVPIVWAHRERRYRTLTDSEWSAFRAGPRTVQRSNSDSASDSPSDSGVDSATVTAAGSRADLRRALDATTQRAVDGIRRVGRRLARQRDVRRAVTATRAAIARRRSPNAPSGTLVDFAPGDVFFDLEAAWNDPEPRSLLLPALRTLGVVPLLLVADVMPLDHPEWFDDEQVRRFTAYIDAHLAESVGFVCISEFTRRELIRHSRARGRRWPKGTSIEPRTRHVTLGADFSASASSGPAAPRGERDRRSVDGPLIVCVGTVEPRKNLDLVVDVWDEIGRRHPTVRLVVVGGLGWKSEATAKRLLDAHERDRRFEWRDDVGDDELDQLYDAATLVIAPSRCEGLGVPVREALARGAPVVSSTGGALPEAGGDAADYRDPDDLDGWIALVDRHLTDPEFHATRRLAAAAYAVPTWDDSAAALLAALHELVPEPGRLDP